MAKPAIQYVCQSCGTSYPRWSGRCEACGEWNSITEEAARESAPKGLSGKGGRKLAFVDLTQSSVEEAERRITGIAEFDRVTGGGLVRGSALLIGGDPGIGKSTLLLQVASHVARSVGPVLYSSGEESEHQIKLRGERLGVDRSPLYLLAETCLEVAMTHLESIVQVGIALDDGRRVSVLVSRQDRGGKVGLDKSRQEQ